MLKFSTNCNSSHQLENILCMSSDENSLYIHHKNNKIYSKLMVEGVLSADAQPGNFLDTLLSIIDCRLHVALATRDNSVINALMDFYHHRIHGNKPKKQSFTRMYKEDDLSAPLRKRIIAHIFTPTENKKYISLDDAGNKLFSRNYPTAKEEYTWTYSVKYLADETIEIYHAFNREVPFILKHLEMLWDLILTEKDFQKKTKFLAQFEWWFMSANVPARSGAGIGDALSIILQRKTNMLIRKEYMHLDWEVLSRSLNKYIAWRSEEIFKRVENQ